MNSQTSISDRLLLPLSAILILGGVALAIAAGYYSRKAVDGAYDILLAGAALQIGESVSVDDGAVMVDLPTSAFELLSLARNDRVFYRVEGPDGATVTGQSDLRLPSGRHAKAAPVFFDATYHGETVRLVALRRDLLERSLSGPVVVVVAQTVQERADLAAAIWHGAVVAVAVVAAAMLLLVWFSVRAALRPLRAVDAALMDKNPKDLSPLELDSPAELTGTIAAINSFIERLRTQVEATQAFIADVSHQLRTALTAIRTQSELAAEEDDPERLRQLAQRIHKRSVGLGRLSTQILNRAMVVHRSDAVPLAALDLRRVVLELDDDDTPPLRLFLPEDAVMVQGDAVSLHEALANLVNNARRYGRPPFAVRLADDAEHKAALLVVQDGGDGIAPEHWPQAGERFNRIGQGGAESAGLGLAIVKAVAEAHGGRLVLRLGETHAFEIGLEIPMVEAGP